MVHKKITPSHSKNNFQEIFWIHPHILYWNGGTRYVFEVTKILAKKYKVNLVVSKTNVESTKKFNGAGVNVIEINSSSTYSPIYWITLPLQLLKEAKDLNRLLEQSPNNILIASMFPSNIIASKTGHKFTQICWEPYAFFYDQDLINSLSTFKSFFTKAMKSFYQRLDIKSTQSANILLTLNKATGRWIKKIYLRKPNAHTYMGVDSNHFKPTTDNRLEKKYQNKKIILHSTDYTELKGTQWAIKSLPLIVKKVPETIMIITSPHSNKREENKIFQLAKNIGVEKNIEFAGNIPYSQLPSYYTLAKLILFTGIGDNGAGAAASLSVLEGLACKTPVVRSHYTREEVENGRTGYLVNPKKPKDIAKSCLSIISNPGKSQVMGDYGREMVIKFYNWNKTTKTIESAINNESKTS